MKLYIFEDYDHMFTVLAESEEQAKAHLLKLDDPDSNHALEYDKEYLWEVHDVVEGLIVKKHLLWE